MFQAKEVVHPCIFDLDDDVLFHLFEDWLVVRDIVSLDLSLCNHDYRRYFSQLVHTNPKKELSLSMGDLSLSMEKYEKMIPWLQNRHIKLRNFPFTPVSIAHHFDSCLMLLENMTLESIDIRLNSYHFNLMNGTMEIIEKDINNVITSIVGAVFSVLNKQKSKKRIDKAKYSLVINNTVSQPTSSLKQLSIRFLSCSHWPEAKVAIWPESLLRFKSFSNLVSLKLEFVMLSSDTCALFPPQWPHLQQLFLEKIVFEEHDCWSFLFLHNHWSELRNLRIVESKRKKVEASKWNDLMSLFRGAITSQQAALPNLLTLHAHTSYLALLAGLNTSKSLQNVELVFVDSYNPESLSFLEPRKENIFHRIRSLSITLSPVSMISIEECVQFMTTFINVIPFVDNLKISFYISLTPIIVDFLCHAVRRLLNSTVNVVDVEILIHVEDDPVVLHPVEEIEELSQQFLNKTYSYDPLCPKLSKLAIVWVEEACNFSVILMDANIKLLSLLFNSMHFQLPSNNLLYLAIETKPFSDRIRARGPYGNVNDYRRNQISFTEDNFFFLMCTIQTIPAFSQIQHLQCISPVNYHPCVTNDNNNNKDHIADKNNTSLCYPIQGSSNVSEERQVSRFLLSVLLAVPRTLTTFIFWVDQISQLTLWQQKQPSDISPAINMVNEYLVLWNYLPAMEKLTCIYDLHIEFPGDDLETYQIMWFEILSKFMEQLLLLVFSSLHATSNRFQRLQLKILYHARKQLRSGAEKTANKILAMRRLCINNLITRLRDNDKGDDNSIYSFVVESEEDLTNLRNQLNCMFTVEVTLTS